MQRPLLGEEQIVRRERDRDLVNKALTKRIVDGQRMSVLIMIASLRGIWRQ